MKKPKGEVLSEFVFGSIPPQHTDLEEAILGAILIDRAAIQTCKDVFGEANPMYLSSHATLYGVMADMNQQSKPLDLMTVNAELKKIGKLDQIGGPHQLVEYTNRVGSTANLEYHCRIVQQDFIQREIIRTGSDLIRLAYEPSTDALDLMELAEVALKDFTNKLVQPVHQGIGRIVSDMLTQADNIRLGKATPGILSGFRELDGLTNGFVPGELYIFAGRPGMGKTAFLLSMIRRMAQNGTPCGFFSLEMSSLQISQRLVSQQSRVELKQVQNPKAVDPVRFGVITTAANQIADLPIFIDETGGLTITQLRGKARAMHREGVRALFVDYIQLMAGSGKEGNREQEISAISRGLKAIAKELHVPVIALSQLSREVEKRPGKRPQLSDLRESGSIEQDAYCVGFLYRPEYYEVYKDPDTGEDLVGVALVIISKHRNGALELDGIKMRFDAQCTEFRDFYGAEAMPEPVSNLNQYAPAPDQDLPF